MYKKLTAVLLLSVLLADFSYGAGFALYEYSGRATAMGGAVMANKAEAASLATNPALITELEGTQAQVGLTVVTADAKTTAAGDSRTLKNDVWYLPNFFITQKWNDQVSVGLGGFSRYGLGGEYKNWETWNGSKLAYKVKLETFSFTPTIAVKANDEFSIAMGLEAMIIGFSQNSTLSTGSVAAAHATGYEISGSGVSWGGNLNGRIAAGMEIPNQLYSGDAKGSIALPDSISAGIAFQATENWVLEAGIVGTFWSSYDQIVIEYKDKEEAPTIHNKKNYQDVYRLNLGTEYMLTPSWALRAGYVYDKSPINEHAMDTLVPVDNRHIASVGVGYKTDSWSVDFAYAHIFAEDLKGNSINTAAGVLPMEYTDGKSDMFSLTFGYKF